MNIHFDMSQRRWVSYASRNRLAEPIYHPNRVMAEHDLVLLIEGDWTIGQEGEEYPVGPGDVFLLPAGRHHYGPSLSSAGMHNLFIHFTATPGDRPGGGVPKEGADLLTIGRVTHCAGMADIRGQFEEIVEVFWSGRPEGRIRCASLLDLLLCRLSRAGNPERSGDPLVDRALELIHASQSRFCTIDGLARQLNVSRRTLTQRFRRGTGVSVHQFQTESKLEAARLQLRHEHHYRLRDIALSLGFYDEFHLSRLYKKRFGIPPSADRRSY